MSVFGTRPDAIKMAPLVKELEARDNIQSFVCSTAQHRQMLDQVLEVFSIKPDYDLDIMKDKQTLEHITVRILEGMSTVLEEVKPDITLVHGDTSTCFAASLSSFYKKIPVGHVEAGLRTFDKYSPFPEEMNRKLACVLSDLHFAPTPENRKNLINEGISEKNIYITGNTALDVLKTTVREDFSFDLPELSKIDFKNNRVIILTAHRRENLGKPLEDICRAVARLSDQYRDIHVIYSVHLNPAVYETAARILGNRDRISLIPPTDVSVLHNLMSRSYMVLTDSGGLQEEAPAMGKPVLVLRNETERPEAIRAGTVKLAGTSEERIFTLAKQLLDDSCEYNKMAKSVNPYGDGQASRRITEALLFRFGYSGNPPEEFTE